MKAIKPLNDYDDYQDLCNELGVNPVGVMDRNYYLHMEVLKRFKNKIEHVRYPEEYLGRNRGKPRNEN